MRTSSDRTNTIDSTPTPPRFAPLLATACAAASAVLLLVQSRVIEAAADAENGTDPHYLSGKPLTPAFLHALPYPVIDPSFGAENRTHAVLIVLAVAQSAVLFLLYRWLRGRVPALAERAGLAVAAAAMIVVAVSTRATESFDVYAYVGYAKLGLAAAYTPAHAAFSGSFAAIGEAWGTSMPASYYGPLWVWLSGIVAGNVPTLGGAILALRWLEVAALVTIVASLALRGTGTPAVALVALNPALYVMYVISGHNDLVAAAFLVAAVSAAKTRPVAAALLVAAAGLVKLPLTVLALAVFAGRAALLQRIAYVALAVVLVVAGSWLFGGRAYFEDLFFRLHEVNGAGSLHVLTARALRLCLLVVAVIGLLAVFVRGVLIRAVTWSLITLSSSVYPWYLAWSLPYAALAPGMLVQFLIVLPVAAALLDPAFPPLGLGQLSLLLMLFYALYEAFRARSRALRIDALPERDG